MASIGRFLQFGGLVLLPIAVLSEATDVLGRESGVADMLIMLGFGVAIFYIGRIFEGYATHPRKLGK